jgi:hypothetical protein
MIIVLPFSIHSQFFHPSVSLSLTKTENLLNYHFSIQLTFSMNQSIRMFTFEFKCERKFDVLQNAERKRTIIS